MVNNVCFCFPLPFFPFPPPPPAGASPESATAVVGDGGPLASSLPELPQAAALGAVSPKILRNDWFPPIACRGTFVAFVAGSVGNASCESFGGAAFDLAPGPGTETGALNVCGVEAADEADHGVLRGPWRKLVAPLLGPGPADGASGGKLLAVDEVEAAART